VSLAHVSGGSIRATLVPGQSKGILMKNLLIIGAGGFGREVLTWVLDHPRNNQDWKVKGFLDSRRDALDGFATHSQDLPDVVPHGPELHEKFTRAFGIVGDPMSYAPGVDDIFLCAVGDPKERQRYARPILDKGGRFMVLIHPTALVSAFVSMGQGSIIGPLVSVSPDVRIGQFVTINSYSSIAHDVCVGDWCEVDGHCLIAGRAKVGTAARIHGGAVLTPDTRIGDEAIVGAGSVVFGRVPAGITVYGNPAKRLNWKEGA